MKLTDWIGLDAPDGKDVGFFSLCGDFGILDEAVPFERNGDTFSYQNGTYALKSRWAEAAGGVIRRQDTFTNLSDRPLVIHRLFSRFTLEGCDYRVYTQFNGWEQESDGQWQGLNTQAVASCNGIRTCEGASPMMALENQTNGLISVLHLLPNAQWKIKATRKTLGGQHDFVVLEAGFEDSGLALEVAPRECIGLPEMLLYTTFNRRDLEAHRLHQAFSWLYPRRFPTPILYNSWMANFDYFVAQSIIAQADVAAELGVECFLIDAGWFGSLPRWYQGIGDWAESKAFGFKGEMARVSQYIRDKGMRFGIWLEPERALEGTPIMKEHPEYFIGGMFLNFAREDARSYILETVSRLIDTYHVGYIKFDFNANLPYDPDRSAYYRYFAGQEAFVRALRQRYPRLYLTNCASGGQRMELGQARLFDSFWPSDDQGLGHQLRICTDTLKRMPPNLMERYLVLTYGSAFPQYASQAHPAKYLCCDDAVWGNVRSFSEHYILNFLHGGPAGLSCDLTALPQELKEKLRQSFAAHKAARDQQGDIQAHILCQNEAITCLEYSDADHRQVFLQCFTHLPHQHQITVYPVLDADGAYDWNETVLTGKDLMEQGITFRELQDQDCQSILLCAKKEG